MCAPSNLQERIPLPFPVDVRHWFCVSADDELAAPGDVRWHALLRSAD